MTNPMNTYPFSSILRHKFYLQYIKGVNVVKPLDYLSYIKEDALNLLKKFITGNHILKNILNRGLLSFTRDIGSSDLVFDTRKVQYSSLI